MLLRTGRSVDNRCAGCPPYPPLDPGRSLMDNATLTAERLAALHRDGFVLLPGVLEPSRIDQARAAIDRLSPVGLDYQGLVDDHYKCVLFRTKGLRG